MKKIKIIDLLNMISKGEEVPKKIKYDCVIYEFNNSCRQYYEEGIGTYFDNKLTYNKSIEQKFYGDFLNDEVEIIEEEQDIDIQAIKELDVINIGNKPKYKNEVGEYAVRVIDIDMMCKIDEIIQAVKQLDKNIKEK